MSRCTVTPAPVEGLRCPDNGTTTSRNVLRGFVFLGLSIHGAYVPTRFWIIYNRARYEALSANTFANTSQNRESLTFPIPSAPNSHNTAYTGMKNLYNAHSPSCGAVAHLGERFNGIEEVGSSILPSSTIIPVICPSIVACCLRLMIIPLNTYQLSNLSCNSIH